MGVYYFMPTMPDMSCETGMELKGERYTAVLKLAMPGPWDVDITFKRPCAEPQKVTVSFNAR